MLLFMPDSKSSYAVIPVPGSRSGTYRSLLEEFGHKVGQDRVGENDQGDETYRRNEQQNQPEHGIY